jgi:hypothetical protein
MTITAEQIAERLLGSYGYELKNCGPMQRALVLTMAQSILDTIRSGATAAAYGAAADMIEDDCSFMSAHQIMRAVQALTDADATAWLADRDAAMREEGALPWRKVAMSGTPGGSEYTDPERCATYLHDTRREMVKAKIENAKLRQDAAAQFKAGQEAAKVDAEVIATLQARAKALEALVSWAYDTLVEINPDNYSHDDVCRMNDASVEVILGLDDTVQALLSKGSPDANA